MRNTSFAQESLDIRNTNSALRSDRGGAAFCASWSLDRMQRFRSECASLTQDGWSGHLRSNSRFEVLELRRAGVQFYVVASEEYPAAAPRVFVAQNDNVIREVPKRCVPCLLHWTADVTLVTVVAEASDVVGCA